MDRETRTGAQPVKIVLQRRAHAGSEREFEVWVRTLVEVASRTPSLEGSSVLTTSAGEYFILLRFASQSDLEQWVASPHVLELLRKGDALAVATDEPVRRSGFETWFTLPGTAPPNAPPPRWKMA